jgi:hypothetical protein
LLFGWWGGDLLLRMMVTPAEPIALDVRGLAGLTF